VILLRMRRMFGQNEPERAINDGTAKSDVEFAVLATKWWPPPASNVSAPRRTSSWASTSADLGAICFALEADTGSVSWRHQLSDDCLPPGTSRATIPAVQDHTVYSHQRSAFLLAINAKPLSPLEDAIDIHRGRMTASLRLSGTSYTSCLEWGKNRGSEC